MRRKKGNRIELEGAARQMIHDRQQRTGYSEASMYAIANNVENELRSVKTAEEVRSIFGHWLFVNNPLHESNPGTGLTPDIILENFYNQVYNLVARIGGYDEL